MNLGSYKLTVIGAVLVLTLSVGVIAIFGTAAQAGSYLAFVAPTTVALLALLRTEQNAKENEVRHAENRQDIRGIRDGQQSLAHDALAAVRDSKLSIEDAALIASQVIHQQEQHNLLK